MSSKEKIKAVFQKEVPPWDQEASWDIIAQSLPSKRRKRPAFWVWFLGLGLLIMGGWTVYQQLHTKQKPMIDVAATLPSKNQEKAVPIEQPISQEAPILANEAPSYSQKESTNSTIVKAQKVDNTALPSTILNRNATTNSDAATPFHPTDSYATNKHLQEGAIHKTKNTTAPLPGNSIAPFAIDPVILLLTPAIKEKHEATSIWSVSFASGISLTKRHLSTSQPDRQAYVDYKNAHEKPLETIGHELGITYRYKNFYLSSGLKLQKTVEYFTGQDVITTIHPVESDSAYFIEENGLITYFAGQINQKVTTGVAIKSPNVLSRYYVPLSIGCQFTLGGHMKLMPYVGFNYNFYTRYQGITVDDALDFVYKDASKLNTLYVKQGNHSYFLGMQADIYRKGPWLLFAGFRWQNDVNAVTPANRQLRQIYSTSGINVGISYSIK